MPVEVIMPKVDMDMASGKLAVWHVEEGATVKKGAALFDIETDKAAMEVEAPASGRLHHILAAPGQVIAVGAPLAFIYAEGEAVGPAPSVASAAATATPEPAPAAADAVVTTPVAAIAAVEVANGTPRATPVARRLAREAAIALESVIGSGPRQRIQKDDVEREIARRAAIKPAAPAPAPVYAAEPAAPAVWSEESGDLHVTTRKGTGTPLGYGVM